MYYNDIYILAFTCTSVTRRERMRNEDIRQELKVAELKEKIRECRLRWYGHVKRMEENEFVRWSGGTRNKEERTPKSDGWAVFGMMGEWWMTPSPLYSVVNFVQIHCGSGQS